MSVRSSANLAIVPVLVLSAVGCMNTTLARVARFEPGRSSDAIHGTAPQTGTYIVKYATGSSRQLHAMEGTARVVGRGGAVGFTRSDDGTVLALACTETIPLESLPPTARYCVWVCREQKPKQWTHEFEKGARRVGLIGDGTVGHE